LLELADECLRWRAVALSEQQLCSTCEPLRQLLKFGGLARHRGKMLGVSDPSRCLTALGEQLELHRVRRDQDDGACRFCLGR